MTRLIVAVLVGLAACGGGSGPSGSGDTHAAAVRPPAEDIIFGIFERKPPLGTTAIKLARDGTLILAHDKDHLDDDKPLATGTWKLEKDTLTLAYSIGMCADSARSGTYKVSLSKVGIHFTKIEDDCAQRAKIDGETWWRVHPKVDE